jgi:virginiamycin A acetyltransferase
MSTVPDPMSIHIPGMIDNLDKNTVFFKPMITSPKIEVGEFTYYND